MQIRWTGRPIHYFRDLNSAIAARGLLDYVGRVATLEYIYISLLHGSFGIPSACWLRTHKRCHCFLSSTQFVQGVKPVPLQDDMVVGRLGPYRVVFPTDTGVESRGGHQMQTTRRRWKNHSSGSSSGFIHRHRAPGILSDIQLAFYSFAGGLRHRARVKLEDCLEGYI